MSDFIESFEGSPITRSIRSIRTRAEEDMEVYSRDNYRTLGVPKYVIFNKNGSEAARCKNLTEVMRFLRTNKRAKEQYPKSDWKYEVTNGDTKLGYDEWLLHRIESEEGSTVKPDLAMPITQIVSIKNKIAELSAHGLNANEIAADQALSRISRPELIRVIMSYQRE